MSAECGFDVFVFHFERLDPEQDVEIGIHGRGGALEVFEETRDARTGGGGDFVVVAPFADHVRPAVASDVERGGVFEAGAAVIRPDRHVTEIGHRADELADGGAVMFDGNRVVLREGVTRQARAERMVDARAAERGIFLKKTLWHRAWFKHAHARAQAVAAADVGEFFQVVEIGFEVHLGPEPARERRGEEVVEARRVGVELWVIFVGDEVLVRHVRLEAVDFAMSETALGERSGVLLGIEAAGGAPVLGVATIPVRAVPTKAGHDEEAALELLAGGIAEAVDEQAHGGEEQRGFVCGDFAGAIGDAEPHPTALVASGGGQFFRPPAGSESDVHAGAGAGGEGDFGAGEQGEFAGGRVFDGYGGGRDVQGANVEGSEGRGHGGFGTELDWCPPRLSRKRKGRGEPVQTKIFPNRTCHGWKFHRGFDRWGRLS